jgi:SAM-dependent methyltransferase
MTDEQTWDARYAESDRIWSGNPNAALVAEAGDLAPGTALDLGCGEGADAIWLAGRGWRVTASDISRVALRRAAEHAAAAGVSVDWQHHDLGVSFPAGSFDLVTSQFLHSWGDLPREEILRRAAAAVAPGGILLIEGHLSAGPFHHDDAHGDLHLPSPAEVIASLELGDGWEVLVSAAHPRDQIGPDGVPVVRDDGTVKVRRALL